MAGGSRQPPAGRTAALDIENKLNDFDKNDEYTPKLFSDHDKLKTDGEVTNNDKLFNQASISEEDKLTLISTYPLLPHNTFKDQWSVFYYIDATTKQIFLDIDDVDAIQAYVNTVPVKDLGGGISYR